MSSRGVDVNLGRRDSRIRLAVGPSLDTRSNQNLVARPALDCSAAVLAGIDIQKTNCGGRLLTNFAVPRAASVTVGVAGQLLILVVPHLAKRRGRESQTRKYFQSFHGSSPARSLLSKCLRVTQEIKKETASQETLACSAAPCARRPRPDARRVLGERPSSGSYDSCELKLAAVFALVVLCIQAQTINARLDALVAPYREANAPGVVAILIREGRVNWQTAFGLADLETHRPITADTQFELASMTKQFTAMAIMILSEQGKLKFDDTLDKYCPEFPAYARTIHIRDLLHHVSGLPDYEELMVGKIGDNFFRSSKSPPAAREFTSAEVLKTLSRQPKLKFTPGSRFEYSNSGYEVLGQIVERATGKRYADFLKEKIFDPLGMHDTLVLDERKQSGPHLALAYRKRNGQWEDITYSPENYEYGDGGVESTGNDLFKWDEALSAGKLVRRATLDLAFTPARTNNGTVIETHFFEHPSAYGFGWFVSLEKDAVVLEHGGDWSGYRTHIIRVPSRQVTAIVLTNSSNNDVGEIAHRIIEIAGN